MLFWGLSLAAAPAWQSSLEAAREQQVVADLDSLRSAILNFYYDVGQWPDDGTIQEGFGPISNPYTAVDCNTDPDNPYCKWNSPYIIDYPSSPPGWSSYEWNNLANGELSLSCYLSRDPSREAKLYLRRP